MQSIIRLFLLMAIASILQACASAGGAGQPVAPNTVSASSQNMDYMYRAPSPGAVSALGLGR